MLSLSRYYEAYDAVLAEQLLQESKHSIRRTALENYLRSTTDGKITGFDRIQKCRKGLDAIDRRGWYRSFHQRMFHDHFIRACARVFWKPEGKGQFARDYCRILETNGWDNLKREVLVSTPRRWVG